MGLSAPVESAVGGAIALIESLVAKILQEQLIGMKNLEENNLHGTYTA